MPWPSVFHNWGSATHEQSAWMLRRVGWTGVLTLRHFFFFPPPPPPSPSPPPHQPSDRIPRNRMRSGSVRSCCH
eukprot:4590627-Pleurochrysis_carterae.AAC.1